MASSKHSVHGSERQPVPGSRKVGPADPGERLEVTVMVRPSNPDKLQEHLRKRISRPMTRDEYEKAHGANSADFEKVSKFASEHGLSVVEQSAARRSIVLSGTVENFNSAFGVKLEVYEHPAGTYRGRLGAVHVPNELKDIVTGVFGLDNRPQAKPHLRFKNSGNVQWHASGTSFTPTQLAELYQFPSATGSGQCIAIIELGGGYRPTDLSAYFSEIGVSPVPKVTAISVDHGRNLPTGSANGPDGEVMLDIEVCGSVAPAAQIAVYFAPNTDQGFLDAITTAIHDKTKNPSVISISWGGPESSWTAQSMQAYDQAFQAAATLGVSVCIASGDNGSTDGVGDGANHVDFPASSSYALGCGGTRVVASGSAIQSEVVWNDLPNGGATGGGVSATFALPSWQSDAHVPSPPVAGGGRGVPDVAANADPETGYQVRVDGSDMVIGGTSAVAPLWAALIARLNQIKGSPLGFINEALYANPSGLSDITSGNNGSFSAGPGWDPTTGLGSPVGVKLAGTIAAKR
jgi:kumamolisin